MERKEVLNSLRSINENMEKLVDYWNEVEGTKEEKNLNSIFEQSGFSYSIEDLLFEFRSFENLFDNSIVIEDLIIYLDSNNNLNIVTENRNLEDIKTLNELLVIARKINLNNNDLITILENFGESFKTNNKKLFIFEVSIDYELLEVRVIAENDYKAKKKIIEDYPHSYKIEEIYQNEKQLREFERKRK